MSAVHCRRHRSIKGLFAGLVVVALMSATGCGRADARNEELLPGRARPLFEHHWPHPRELKFPENRFTPPDPALALVPTGSGVRAYVVADAGDRVVQLTAAA